MAKKEVYRSFEGKLGVDNRVGYIVYEITNFYEIEILSVWSDAEDICFRVPKKDLSDFADDKRIDKLLMGVEHGSRAGQIYHNGKWYSQERINSIQKSRRDYDWKKYV